MKYIVANWKMNLNASDLLSWLDAFAALKVETANTVILAPSFPYLPLVANSIKNTPYLNCAAQDVSIETKGAHTGKVGTFQIKDFCKFCIVGHSETGDNLETTLTKRDVCLGGSIQPIVCFKTTSDFEVVTGQNIITAWEDPENISKEGVYAAKEPGDIRDSIDGMKSGYPQSIILYGGSVNENNITDLAAVPTLDGVLVGNASLKPEIFAKIILAFNTLNL